MVLDPELSDKEVERLYLKAGEDFVRAWQANRHATSEVITALLEWREWEVRYAMCGYCTVPYEFFSGDFGCEQYELGRRLISGEESESFSTHFAKLYLVSPNKRISPVEA